MGFTFWRPLPLGLYCLYQIDSRNKKLCIPFLGNISIIPPKNLFLVEGHLNNFCTAATLGLAGLAISSCYMWDLLVNFCTFPMDGIKYVIGLYLSLCLASNVSLVSNRIHVLYPSKGTENSIYSAHSTVLPMLGK
jgi:hypothetical protein